MSTSTNDHRLRQFDEEMLRAEYASLFWAVIMERRKSGTLTLQSIADTLGIDKSGVSRWFSGDPPNWELNTVASIASALNLYLQPPHAIDRTTGAAFTPAGLQADAGWDTTSTDPAPPPKVVSTGLVKNTRTNTSPPETTAA